MLEIKRGSEHITKTFRLPEGMVEELAQIAADNSISLNNLVVQCLRYALDNIDRGEIDHSATQNNKKK